MSVRLDVQYFIKMSNKPKSCLVYLKVTGYMFRLAKEPSSGQLQSLNEVYNGVCAH
jgi:hypothetical protein